MISKAIIHESSVKVKFLLLNKLKLVFFSLLLTLVVLGQKDLYAIESKDIITNPSIGRNCRYLIKKRNDKVRVLQRLNSLLLRNKKLIKRVRPNEKSLKSKLDFSHTRITNTIELTKLTIKKMEENIVRSGCPGISL